MRRSLLSSAAVLLLGAATVAVTGSDGADAASPRLASAASWSTDPITLTDDRAIELTGLDCADSEEDGVCLAVGSTTGDDQSRHLTVVRRTGSGWVHVKAAMPRGASDATLSAISCLSLTSCFAVGRAAYGRSVRTVVEQSASAAWRLQDSPRPVATVAELASVSCVAENFCVAVGDAGSRTTRSALIEAWNGTQWRLVDAADSGLPSTQLLGVNCTSPVSCVAVGAAGPSATTTTTLVEETWNGSTWSVFTSGSGDNAELTSVDCTSATFCLAVGDLRMHGVRTAVAARWNGTAWTAVTVPPPAGTNPRLPSISCVSPTYCLAVGTDRDQYQSEDTIAVAWNGSAFVAAPAPFFYQPLQAVRCFSAGECVGVGGSAEVLADGQWEFENFPQQTGAVRPTQLRAVSCMESMRCVAIGTQYDDREPLGLRSNGIGWQFAFTTLEQSTVTDNAVSCGNDTVSSCLLSGSIHQPRTMATTVVERFTGRGFTVVPGVPNVGASQAISCIGDFCVLAGDGAVAMLDGSSWTSVPIIGPGGSQVELDGVACLSADDCTLVGGYYGSDPMTESVLIERWDGVSWRPVDAPTGRPGRLNTLRAVDCSSSSSCVAVGTAHGSSDESLVYQWDGATWQSVTHPGTGAGLASVACAAAGSCMAVGPSGSVIASADGTWARSRIAVPPGDTGALPTLTGITYLAGTYHVVGSYGRLGDQTALAETLSG